jgi:predicted SAM-dependent methyltransferase
VTWLNLGCGPKPAPGWLNCDLRAAQGVDLRCDLRGGLPLGTASVDAVAGIHLLQDLAWNEVLGALRELHRVLKPGGVLRIAVPDLDKAIHAYLAGDAGYFYVPDRDARSVGAKLVTQVIWYGSVRTPFTRDFLREWMSAAGFSTIAEQPFGESRRPGLASLDNRRRESLFMEGTKDHGSGQASGDIAAS